MQRDNPEAPSRIPRRCRTAWLIAGLVVGTGLVFVPPAGAKVDGQLDGRHGGTYGKPGYPSVSSRVAPAFREQVKSSDLRGFVSGRSNSGQRDRWDRVAKRSISKSRPSKRRTGGRGVRWAASSRCLNGRLKAAIYHVASTYGRVRVNSTCRGRRGNRRTGGARRSYHLGGNAADIRIWGNVRAAARYLRSVSGGYKHYGGGLFHIDTGPRRRW